MKTLLIVLAVSLVAVASDAPEPAAADVAKNYAKLLTKLTDKPRNLGVAFAADCKLVPPDKTKGPHGGAYVNYFRDAIAQKPGEKFAPGSVLVKEKLKASVRGDEPTLEAVGGMIKRLAGTHPKSGDWEFFWFEEGKLTTKGLEHCAGCHSGAKKDYVFTDIPPKPDQPRK